MMNKVRRYFLPLFCLAALIVTTAHAQTPPLFKTNAKYLGFAGTDIGTANAQKIAYSPATTALTVGQVVSWVPSHANTTATTLVVDAIASKPVVKLGGAALIANDLVTTAIAVAWYDGTSFELIDPQSVVIAVNIPRVCDVAVGDTSGGVITDAQLGPQKRLCYIPAAATIVEMDVAADAGTPNVIVAVDHAGSKRNIVSGALATASSGAIACSKTTSTTGIDGVTTCTGTLQNTSVAAGDYLEMVSGTAGGTAKLMTIHVIYTVN